MFFPNQSTPAALANKFCVPWNPNDPLEPLYDQAALQFNTDSDPSLAAWIKICLQNQMMCYAKAQCTDCATQGLPPTQTVILAGSTGVQVAAPQGYSTGQPQPLNTQLGLVSALPGLINEVQNAPNTTSALGDVASGAAQITAPIPIVSQITAIIADIANIFTGHHAAAVATEQADNCAVAFAFNKYIPSYDYAVYSGKLTADAALADVTQLVQQQLIPGLEPVIKAHNIGWGQAQILQAHVYFRTTWYPQLESNVGVLGSGVLGSLTSNPLLLAAIAVGAALLLGGRKREATA